MKAGYFNITFIADTAFKLAAISVVDNDSAGEVKVNVSALIHLAAELIEADEGGVTANTVTEQSTKVASTFGVVGDITQLEATVTTDAEAVAGEDNEAELRLGLINAGIMAAMFSGEADDATVLSTKLTKIAADLIKNNGALLVNQDEATEGFELAVSDVLEGAAAAASTAGDAIADNGTLTSIIDVTQEETNLANEQAYKEANVGEGGLSEVVVDVPTEGDAVAKAKAMVDDVRLFTHLFDETTTEGEGIVGQGDEYVALMDDASSMISAEADSFNLLAQVSEVLAELSMQYDDDTLTPAASAAGVNISTMIEGATGVITFDENTAAGGVLFNINATAGSEVVTLNASAEFIDDGKSIVLNLDGSIESSGAKLILSEGSFAQVNLDSVASRTAFDDDTFEGEIISGELKLDLTLEQKATDAVTDPVTFTGMLHTKLLPVKERALDENFERDYENQRDIANYGRPGIETFVLPEMLSLSGAFSSLGGDEISATLTVNINDLAAHEAPDFKYIGKEVASILNITLADDVIVLTEADSVSDEEQYTVTHNFTAGTQAGEWTASRSAVAKNPDLYWGGKGYEQQHFSTRTNANTLDEVITYTRAHIIDRNENFFSARSIRITPADQNDDGIIDGYHYFPMYAHTGNVDAMIDSDGNINLAALVNESGQILTVNGPQMWDEFQDSTVYSSIEDIIEQDPWLLPFNPLTMDSTSKFFVNSLGETYPLTVDDIGTVTTFFSEDELDTIAVGDFTELNPKAYVTQPTIKDTLSIEVSDDENTVIAIVEGAFSSTQTFSGGNGSNFTYRSEDTESGGNTSTTSYWSEVSTDNGLDVPEVVVSNHFSNLFGDTYADQLKFVPVDDQVEGEEGFGIADRVDVFYIGGWGNSFNDAGNLVNNEGTLIEFIENSWMITSFQSYGDFDWTTESWGTYDFGRNGWNPLSFNPLTVSSAVDVYGAELLKNPDYRGAVFIDGIGQVEIDLKEDSINALSAGNTTTFDGINIIADSRFSLEDEDNFIDVNAALTLEAMLGEYQVKLQLSGERTALDDGTFALGMSYRLPGTDAQRSFTAHYNTEEEGRLTANNADGVVLVLNEPDEDATGTQVLGQILVGPTAIVAATIEDRDGLIVVVYSDETTESL